MDKREFYRIVKLMIVISFIVLFCVGSLFILKSDTWNMGDFYSMNLFGAILSTFSGMGLLIILYKEYKKK